jgi:hypothetical protein
MRPPVSYPPSMRLAAPGGRYPVRAPLTRPSFYHQGHSGTVTHSFFIRTYPLIYPYPYVYPSYAFGYFPTDLFGDSYDGYDNGPSQQYLGPEAPQDYSAYPQQVQPDYPQQAPPPEYGYSYPQAQPVPDGAYAYPVVPPGYEAYAQPAPVTPQMQYVPGSATTIILIYRDGRPPEEIQNYLATRSTLTILDGGRRREVPLSDLDIPATMSANRQTGVDFQLPTGAR